MKLVFLIISFGFAFYVNSLAQEQERPRYSMQKYADPPKEIESTRIMDSLEIIERSSMSIYKNDNKAGVSRQNTTNQKSDSLIFRKEKEYHRIEKENNQ